MATQAERIRGIAHAIEKTAMETGNAAGLHPGTESVIILENALAIAYAKMSRYRGINDTRERLLEDTMPVFRERNRALPDLIFAYWRDLQGETPALILPGSRK